MNIVSLFRYFLCTSSRKQFVLFEFVW